MTSIVTKGKIISPDIEYWNGIDDTATRKESTGGSVIGAPVGNYVDVLHAYGGGTSYTYGTINDCVNRIASRERTLFFRTGTWVIDNDLTIGSNFTCRIPAGCVFQVASGKTLTFNGPVITDSQTWTSGTVTVNGSRTYEQPSRYKGASPVIYEGATDDAFETTVTVTDPTADRTLTIPDQDVDLSDLQTGGDKYIAAVAGTDTYTGTLSPVPAAYTAGMEIAAIFTNANTSTTPTLNLNSLGAKTIVTSDGNALKADDIKSDYYAKLLYDGTNFRLLNPSKAAFRGALVYRTTNQIINNVSQTVIEFDNEIYDTDAIHDNATNNTRLIVPTNTTRVRLIAQYSWALHSIGSRSMRISKNSGNFLGQPLLYKTPVSSYPTSDVFMTPILTVIPGDYFELIVFQDTGGLLAIEGNALGNKTWFSMEIIE